MAIRVLAVMLAAAALPACDALPRDVAGTSARIAATHVIRVGVAAPIGADGRVFLARLARDRGARVAVTRHALEPLLLDLEAGRLDLVVAPFAADSDWAARVALSDPLDGGAVGDRTHAVRAAMRNGESRWVMEVERVVRAR